MEAGAIMEAGAPDYLLDWSSRGRKDIIFMTFTPRLENAILSLSIKILEHFRKCIMCIVV